MQLFVCVLISKKRWLHYEYYYEYYYMILLFNWLITHLSINFELFINRLLLRNNKLRQLKICLIVLIKSLYRFKQIYINYQLL